LARDLEDQRDAALAALTASQAETAAAYEAAARAMVNLVTYCPLSMPEQYRNGWLKGATEVSMAVDQTIRALTPASSKAALDRIIAEAEERGMRKAAAIRGGSTGGGTGC
jgi:hypothetical protein